MGYGDEIMAAGQAQRAYEADPAHRKVAICDRRGEARWHPLWEGNPVIATPREVANGLPVQRIRNGANCRPYLKSLTVEQGAVYSDWRAADHVGRLYLTPAEQSLGHALLHRIGPYVVIEPAAKSLSCVNKRWGADRYQSVVDAYPQVRWVQMVYDDWCGLDGVQAIRTESFRDACGVLASASAYVGPEGGLHHAAAALGLPAVVIFGGFISPETTGYPSHVNLADSGPGSPCGTWRLCEHCRAALARITPAQVIEALTGILAQHDKAAS